MIKFIFFSLVNLTCLACFGQSCCGDLSTEIYSNLIRYSTTYSASQLNYNGQNVSLSARITESAQNACTKKPFILFLHGGGFSAGSPILMDSIASEFARRGYFTASIEYRLGFKNNTLTCPIDTVEFIRAWYRATQDAKSAVRFFKEKHNDYGLDTNLFFAGGWSAGGYVLPGLAWMNDESEKPIEAGQLNDTLITNQLYARPDLGSPHGTTNLNGFSSKVNGIFSFSSSFLFPEHIDPNEQTALLYFNNKQDEYSIPWTACNQDAWDYECADGIPKSCGIESIVDILDLNNIPYQYTLFDTPICSHNLHDPCFPMYNEEVNQIVQFLNELSDCPIITDINHVNKTKALVTLIISENEINDFKLSHSNWIAIDATGAQIQISPNAQLSKGFYTCLNFKNSADSLRIIIQ